jgi:hypothetical protein
LLWTIDLDDDGEERAVPVRRGEARSVDRGGISLPIPEQEIIQEAGHFRLAIACRCPSRRGTSRSPCSPARPRPT